MNQVWAVDADGKCPGSPLLWALTWAKRVPRTSRLCLVWVLSVTTTSHVSAPSFLRRWRNGGIEYRSIRNRLVSGHDFSRAASPQYETGL